MECVRLRVKDVDFEQNQVTVREGKGFKDRQDLLARACPKNPHFAMLSGNLIDTDKIFIS